MKGLTHWGRVTHICVGKLIIIGSDNGLSPGRRQAIIWTNAGILLIGPLGTNFIEILIGIQTFSFKKMHLKMSSAKWRPFCLGLNVLSKQAECIINGFYPTVYSGQKRGPDVLACNMHQINDQRQKQLWWYVINGNLAPTSENTRHHNSHLSRLTRYDVHDRCCRLHRQRAGRKMPSMLCWWACIEM